MIKVRLLVPLALALPASACGGGSDAQDVPLACASEQDDERDGEVDVYWTFDYDAEGRVILETGDYRDGGREDDERFVWDYDGLGNETLLEWYVGDTLAYYREKTYDSEGNQLTYEWGFDGGIRIAETYFYEEGRHVATDYDRGADGTIDERRSFSYRGDRVDTEEVVSPEDSGPLRLRTYRYDGPLLVAIETDRALDGYGQDDLDGDPIDDLETFEYDGDGNLTRRVVDLDADGEFEYRASATYDTEGRLIETIHEEPASGAAPETHRWTYGDAGELLVYEITGRVEQRTSYLFDCPAARRSGSRAPSRGRRDVVRIGGGRWAGEATFTASWWSTSRPG